MPTDEPSQAEVSTGSDLLSPPDRVQLSRSPHPYHRRSDSSEKDQDEHPHSSPDSSRWDSTESGTEADDERIPILKRLPAPPIRSHKGLRGSTPSGLSPNVSPLPSPPATLHDTIQETIDYFGTGKETEPDISDEDKRREVYLRRKKGEILRRATETLLLAAIALLSFAIARRSSDVTRWYGELVIFMVLPPVVYGLYPLRKVVLARTQSSGIGDSLARGLHLPSRFDPGPLLYPIVLPVIVALSVADEPDAAMPINIICGLCSIPSVVTAIWHQPQVTPYLRWVLPLLPIHLASHLTYFKSMPFGLKIGTSTLTLEDLVLIPPLHDALKSVLHYTTTTSLDPAELELLTSAMIDLLLLGTSPQTELLTGLLWVGGLSTFVSCRYLLEWVVELARIPKWRFAKRPSTSIFQRMAKALSALKAESAATDSSDDEIDARLKPLQRVKTLGMQVANGTTSTARISLLGRRNTISGLDPMSKHDAESKARRTVRHQSLPPSQFISLTKAEAKTRKYLYTGAVYLLVLAAIMLPTRVYVSQHSLAHHEPFGWAVGYVLGDIPQFHDIVERFHLTSWIPLSPPIALSILPSGNLRLLLCAYCLTVLLLGIAIVLSLTSYMEVDTRRKGFHGVMVFMLLPTIFFDPCFFSLALALILAAFLLLDLFRASQLPPISRPLTYFLAPYVDGRDHRGPVIVSHIFLLIGCAIPLWLSLADLPRLGSDPRQDWDVTERNVSMIGGVVCVGMGDAAASLIGRRYGKTKWYWRGGKSVEGSLAFVVAVTLGLMFAYTWLRVGGWVSWDDYHFTSALTKCLLAGSGASLLESVLTAANDNVVVPIGLWLLIRGLEI